MKNKRQDQVYEMLSAYLDAELSGPERMKLESALKENPALRQQYQALNATRSLLRHAPRIKVPRNFTLTSAMLPQKRPFSFWMPAMSISSALAAILLVLTYIVNLSPISSPMLMQNHVMEEAASAESFSSTAADNANAMDKSAAENEPPMIIQWFGGLSNGKGGGADQPQALAQADMLAEEPAAALAPMLEAPDDIDMTMEMEAQPGATSSALMMAPQAEESIAEETAPLERLATPPAMATEVQAQATSLDDGQIVNPILGISPAEDRGQIIDESTRAYGETNGPRPESYPMPTSSQPSMLAILRPVLLIISLICAAAAFLLRRFHSPKI